MNNKTWCKDILFLQFLERLIKCYEKDRLQCDIKKPINLNKDRTHVSFFGLNLAFYSLLLKKVANDPQMKHEATLYFEFEQ